jgi:hypothetical protein
MIEYRLIDGGYEIYVNGAKVIHQPHSPTRGLDAPLAEGDSRFKGAYGAVFRRKITN